MFKGSWLLIGIKLLHTLIWVFFAGCVLALPLAGVYRRFRCAAVLGGLVLAECVVLASNHFRCPLTSLAARYTENRAANFDIYLPQWLARKNQIIFGTLFAAGAAFVLWRWVQTRRGKSRGECGG